GCGADANPEPRGEMKAAHQNGRAVADEVERLLAGQRLPVDVALSARMERIQLPFGDLPSREELAQRAKTEGRVGDYARSLLAELDRTGSLPKELDYSVGVWTFGDDLAMVFLAGEVVVDYALRLKRELDGTRLWVTAYANDVPCYIASKRLLPEGGYEVDSSMISYGRPTRFAPEAEDRIVDTVQKLIPVEFKSPRTSGD
ncbi:MAG: hypothetical protein ACC645_26020, partial [Pirellulales bacterium]